MVYIRSGYIVTPGDKISDYSACAVVDLEIHCKLIVCVFDNSDKRVLITKGSLIAIIKILH